MKDGEIVFLKIKLQKLSILGALTKVENHQEFKILSHVMHHIE